MTSPTPLNPAKPPSKAKSIFDKIFAYVELAAELGQAIPNTHVDQIAALVDQLAIELQSKVNSGNASSGPLIPKD